MAETISQVASDVNIHFHQGDTFRRRLFFFTLDDDGETQIPEDVSSWEITAQIRVKATSSDATDFAVDMTDAADGYVWISITAAQAAELRQNNVWDLQRDLTVGATPAGVERLTLLAGTVTVDREVTRDS